MHLMYAVDFRVESTTDNGAYGVLLDHVAEWLSRGSVETITAERLAADGSERLSPDTGSWTLDVREAAWRSVTTADDRAVEVAARQTLTSGIELLRRVALSEIEESVVLRAAVSRAFRGGALVPVQDARADTEAIGHASGCRRGDPRRTAQAPQCCRYASGLTRKSSMTRSRSSRSADNSRQIIFPVSGCTPWAHQNIPRAPRPSCRCSILPTSTPASSWAVQACWPGIF